MKILEKFLDILKSRKILERKPGLKLCSNHFVGDHVSAGRTWCHMGTAFCDGKGWYTTKQQFKRVRRGKRRKRNKK